MSRKKYGYKYTESNTNDEYSLYMKNLSDKKKGKSKHQRHPKQETVKFEDLPPEQQGAMRAEFIEVEGHLQRLCWDNRLGKVLQRVEPLEYYRDMFPIGSFEECDWVPLLDELGNVVVDANGDPVFKADPGIEQRPNGMISIIKDRNQKNRSYTRIIFDDLAEIEAQLDTEADKILVSPVSFSGRKRRSNLAYGIFGMTIDLDNVGVDQINDLIYEMQNDVLPMATYLIHTASGLHVSYLFEDPIPAYPQYFESLNRLKADLSNMIWNQHTSRDEKKQFQGIFQGFRMVGTSTKLGKEFRSTAFKLGTKVTLRYLNEFADKENRCNFDDIKHVSIQKAKELWPDWFYRHFVEERAFGDYSLSDKEKIRRRAWYEAWKDRLKKGAVDGNRHYCIGVLFHYAMKAEIDIDEALDDALALVPYLNSLTVKKDNEFTDDDVYCAMVYYDRKYIRMGRKGIKRLTNIDIGQTVRKGRKQETHLKIARNNRDVLCEERGKEHWYDGGGRPKGSKTKNSKYKKQVQEWRRSHPNGRKADCIRDTGLSKPTVLKWWDSTE